MVGHYFGHEQRNLVGRVELARLFSGIGGKHADEVFVNEPQNVVVLPAVHGDDIYQLDKIADGLCLRAGAVAKLGKPGLQGIKNAVEDFFVRGVNEAAEGRERVAYIGHVKVSAHFKPGGEQVFVGDKVAYVLLDGLDGNGIVFRQGLDVVNVELGVGRVALDQCNHSIATCFSEIAPLSRTLHVLQRTDEFTR